MARRHNARLAGSGSPAAPFLLPTMTENDARAVLLMRACERATLLGVDDAAWAGREARRQLGESAPAPVWLGRRASLALGRLAERQPRLRRRLAMAQSGASWWPAVALLVLAAGFGLLGDGLGTDRRINLLALPLLGLLAWNLAVYILVLLRALRPHRQAGLAMPGEAAWLVPVVARWLQRLRALGARWLHGPQLAPSPARQAFDSFTADWLVLGRPVLAWRSTALLHAGAALLALGTLVALYARGLVFDYRAGWDSTFLDAAQVRALLGLLLGPASALADLPLPDAAALAKLRFSGGGLGGGLGGEGAAPWIHRWALTLALLVLLPRLALAAHAAWQARRLSARLPLPDDPAVHRLLQAELAAAGATPRAVAVVPYSYRLDAARQAAVPTALANLLGAGLRCDLQPTLQLGAEDRISAWLPRALGRLPVATSDGPATAPLLVLLFALTATPEHETHGALVLAVRDVLRQLPAPQPQLRVVVDESGFRKHAWGPDGAERINQRRAAWERLLLDLRVVPGFIDLNGLVNGLNGGTAVPAPPPPAPQRGTPGIGPGGLLRPAGPAPSRPMPPGTPAGTPGASTSR
jgi:hypothetical protein